VSKYRSDTLGQFLRRLRLEKGLEQKELAQRLQVSKVTVCNWEKDRKKPSRKSMDRLAQYLKMGKETLEDLKMDWKTRKKG
jgi:transcriptional regulator with XRE-family HTH domain